MVGGPPATLSLLTEAEELALIHNTGRPVTEGIPGGAEDMTVRIIYWMGK